VTNDRIIVRNILFDGIILVSFLVCVGLYFGFVLVWYDVMTLFEARSLKREMKMYGIYGKEWGRI